MRRSIWGMNREEKGAWKAEIEEEKSRKITGLKKHGSHPCWSKLPSHQCQ